MISDGQMSGAALPRVVSDGMEPASDLGRHLVDPVAQVRDFLDDSETPRVDPLRLVHRSLRGRYLLAAGVAALFAAMAGTAGFLASKPQYLSNGTIRVSANKPSILSESPRLVGKKRLGFE